MLFNQKKLPAPLKGFERVNRYWDRVQQVVVAKILPGEFYVSSSDEVIATTLGSCVSACIWDDRSRIGGMNHFMLPETEQERHEVTWGNALSDANRYGNYAMEHLINEILKFGGLRKNLRAKVFGGGKVLKQKNDVGAKNSAFVLEYLKNESIVIVSSDLRSDYARKVLFNPLTGQAFMKKIETFHNSTIEDREKSYLRQLEKLPVEGDIELF